MPIEKPNLNTIKKEQLISWAKENSCLDLDAWAETTMSPDREYTDDEIYNAWANACIGEGELFSVSL